MIRHPHARTGLAGMILEVWYDEVYTGRFYTPAPGDVIVDAGANIGLFSLLVCRLQPDCKVFAFEPFEENYRLLTENLAAAGASAVRAFPFGLAGESGVSVITDGGGRSQDHRLTANKSDAPGCFIIRTCSLAEVLQMTGAETVHLFKCDIEGAEHDLFAAATDDTLRRVRRYAIEYHDNIRPGTLDLLVERLGPSHVIDVQPASEGGYGMLYAANKTIERF
jgi:FkbM family methyltransferase